MRELTLPAPLILLPGLGADAALFSPQRDAFGDAIHVPDWIEPQANNESLGSYAKRWAESINAQVQAFSADRPWFLSGMSMGGMLALEMLPHLTRKPAAVLLIASCQSTPTWPLPIRLGAAVASTLPEKLVALLVKLLAIPVGVLDRQDDAGNRLLKEMAARTTPARLKWAIGATTEWTYPGPPQTLDDQPTPPIFHIHGRQDWIIPLNENDADLVIDAGRHLLNLSHPHTVNRWLFDHITQLCGIDESHEPRVESPRLATARRPEIASRY